MDIAFRDSAIHDLHPDTVHALRVAIVNCTLGTTLCHEGTLKRQIQDGVFAPKPTNKSLSAVLLDWQRTLNVESISVKVLIRDEWTSEPGPIPLQADWVLILQMLTGVLAKASSKAEHNHGLCHP